MGQGTGKKENPPQVVQMKTLQCKGHLRIKEASKKDGEGPRNFTVSRPKGIRSASVFSGTVIMEAKC